MNQINATLNCDSVFSKSVPFKLKHGAKQNRHELNQSGEDMVEEISETSSENEHENDDLTAPEWLQNIEQRATVDRLKDSHVELKPDDGILFKMSR